MRGGLGEEEKDHFGGEGIWTKLEDDNAGCFLVRVCFGEIVSIWLLLDDRLIQREDGDEGDEKSHS